MKKLFILLFILVFTVSMGLMGAGCKEEVPSAEEVIVEEEVAEEEVAEEEVAEEEVAEEEVTISFTMHVGDVKSTEPSVYWIVQEFMKENPNIFVDLQGTPGNLVDDHVKNMKMYATAGTLPDIFWMIAGIAKEMAAEGFLLDLNDFIENNRDITDNIPSNMTESFTLDNGSVFGLPYTGFISGLWVNKSLFDKYGLQIPETYEDLKEAVNVFNENNIVSIAQSSKDTFSTWAYQSMLHRYGFFEKLDSILAGEEKYNNPDFLNLYKKLDELRILGAFPENISVIQYFEAVEMFLAGDAAMLNAGHWVASRMSEVDFDVSFWWGPTFSDGVGNQKIMMFVPGPPLVVRAEIKEEQAKYDALTKFLRFYYSQEGAGIMVDNGFPPVINYDLTSIEKEGNEGFYTLIEQTTKPGWVGAVNQPDMAIPETFVNAINDSLLGVMNGIYTPEEALDVVDREIEILIK